jgi:hypothetical protein
VKICNLQFLEENTSGSRCSGLVKLEALLELINKLQISIFKLLGISLLISMLYAHSRRKTPINKMSYLNWQNYPANFVNHPDEIVKGYSIFMRYYKSGVIRSHLIFIDIKRTK